MNRFSKIITKSKKNGAAQAMLYALPKFSCKKDLQKTQVGIASCWYEGNPCNNHLCNYADYLGSLFDNDEDESIISMIFNTIGVSDGISMGTDGMRYSLPSVRNFPASFSSNIPPAATRSSKAATSALMNPFSICE